jgi:hypothetical protein
MTREDARMDYDAVAAAFLTPLADTPAMPRLPDTPARRLRDAVEPIATIGWWSREAAASVTGLGHDFFDGYVWGRAASLGADVAPTVVVAAFGAFEPQMLTAVLTHARGVSSAADVLAARSAGASAGLRAATTAVSTELIDDVAGDLLTALGDLDSAARPLFASLRAQPLPADPHGRLWRAAEMVREHRGDGHLGASIAAGLDALSMNILTEVWLGYPVGEYSATRGFDSARVAAAAAALAAKGWVDAEGAMTVAGRLLRDAIEDATDTAQDCLIDALGSDIDDVLSAVDIVGAAVLAAHRSAQAGRRLIAVRISVQRNGSILPSRSSFHVLNRVCCLPLGPVPSPVPSGNSVNVAWRERSAASAAQ